MNPSAPRDITAITEETAADSRRTLPQHITICVCTYKRPAMLRRLLAALTQLKTDGLFTYSVVVSDNDEARSAESTVEEAQKNERVGIAYVLEPRRNIALARNRAVENAGGEYVAFIDDDEIPNSAWLLTLFRECRKYKVDGVLGPVLRRFDKEPPAWFRKSDIYVRRINPTGMPVDWHEARTGNVLMKRTVIGDVLEPFRPQFRAGEDQDFFRRKIEEGYVFIWCSDGVVFETIPPARWRRSYILRKALLQGATAALQPDCGVINIAKSLIAVPLYLLMVPAALIAGHHYFMRLMIKICDHTGKLLMRIGINPIHEEYVSE
jgi:succinoglycan biosynthesis protein ExoM